MSRSVSADPVLLAQRQHPAAPALLPEAIEFLFHVLGNRRSFFDEARVLLKVEHFLPTESLFSTLWETMGGLADSIAGKFTHETLSLALRAKFRDRAVTLPAHVEQTIFAAGPGGVVWTMTNTAMSAEHAAYARQVLQRFLQERAIAAPLRRLLQGATHPQNIDEIIGTVRDFSARLSGMSEVPRVNVAPVRGQFAFTPALTYKPTGIAWIDSVDRGLGGQVVGDCYGLIAPTGGGKAQPLDAVVMTPHGPRRMGDMCVGASVCTPDGGVAVVKGVYPQGKLPVYEVRFADGATTRCCGDHLWQVDAIMDGWAGRVYTTDKLREALLAPTGRPRFSIRTTSPVSMYHRPVMLDPYVVGVLIGDGCLVKPGSIQFSSVDSEIIEAMGKIVPGYRTKKTAVKGCDYRIVREGRRSNAPNVIKDELGRLGLHGKYSYEKEIPEDYLYTDVGSRWALLQGLMDTDGSAMMYPGHDDRCRLEFSTTSPKLCSQFVWLVQSLGGLATVGEKRVPGNRLAYRVCVKFNDPATCFRLARKKARCRKRIKYFTKRPIVAIMLVGHEECQCIAVDHPEQLYLTNDFVVTHNTSLACHMAVASARVCWGEATQTRINPEFVAYVSVEEEGKKLNPRIWSAAFQIPLRKLRTMRDWSELTTQANLEPYERRLVVGPGPVPSESDRYDAHQPMLQRCFELLDFSGGGDFPNAGKGYIPELAAALESVRQSRGQGLRSVFVDYAGLLVERYLGGNLDDRKLRLWLKRIGDDFRALADRFQCTFWILHQIRGAAGNASPLKLMRHTDAGETTDFANNMAACGCMGTVDSVTGCRRLNWSKTRNTRNEGISPVTLRIHDDYATMEDVTTMYVTDEATKRFVSRREASQVMGMPTAASAAGAERPRIGAAATQAHLQGGYQ